MRHPSTAMGTERTVRLGCFNCLRDDLDGITPGELAEAIRQGWEGVREVQTHEEACKIYDDPADEPPGFSVDDWQTHLGICPECSAGDPVPENREVPIILKLRMRERGHS